MNIKKLILILAPVLFGACNTYKYVPEDSHYLANVKIKAESKVVDRDELKQYISQKSNKRVLGVKFHLFLYNLSNPAKDKKIHNYLRRIGEKPVIWDPYQNIRSTEQLQRILSQKGYFDAFVDDSVHYQSSRKVGVVYHIDPGKPHRIGSFDYEIADPNIKRIVYKDTVNRKTDVGKRFEVADLVSERTRVERVIRENGYYLFTKENFISYIVDTSANLKVGVTMEISATKDAEGFEWPHTKFAINNVYIFRNYNPREFLDNPEYIRNIDTLYYEGIYFLSVGDVRIKPGILAQSNYIIPGSYYNQRDEELTIRHLTSLRVFRNVEVDYRIVAGTPIDDGVMYLDCYINLTPLTRQFYQLEASATNSSGNIGGEASIRYQYKNLLGNAEILDVALRGAAESLFLEADSNRSNSTQIGVEAKLNIPKFLVPFKTEQFIKKFSPKTTIVLSYSYHDRPQYFEQKIANFSYGYNWRGNRFTYYYIDPVRINLVAIDTFSNFQGSRLGSYRFYRDLDDKLITSTEFSFEYSNKSTRVIRDFVYFRYNLVLSGNTLKAYKNLFESSAVVDSVFGIPFSQFARTDFDLRYYDIKSKEQTIVYRLFFGIAYPYGNSSVVPLEYRYYMGGPNSMRAWSTFYLGPGSMSDTTGYHFLTGRSDIKIEMNAEYRFDIIWKMKGAFFMDCGNIWSIARNEEREGAGFSFNRFYKELALGMGFGARFDFDFLIVRFDWGLQVHNPAGFKGNKVHPHKPEPKWLFDKRGIERQDFAIQFGVAYPF